VLPSRRSRRRRRRRRGWRSNPALSSSRSALCSRFCCTQDKNIGSWRLKCRRRLNPNGSFCTVHIAPIDNISPRTLKHSPRNLCKCERLSWKKIGPFKKITSANLGLNTCLEDTETFLYGHVYNIA
jgi:hypothetical protein